MRKRATSILLACGPDRVARADFGSGAPVCRTGPRPRGGSLADAVGAAAALGERPRGNVIVLANEIFAQDIALNPSQIQGLTNDQIGRALAFEIEPFSGLPVADCALGFARDREGGFSVVALRASDRENVQRLLGQSGAKLAGMANADGMPADSEALAVWFEEWQRRIEGGAVPLVRPPAPPPSPHRHRIAAVLVLLAVIAGLAAYSSWLRVRKAELERRNSELTLLTNQGAEARRRIDEAARATTTLEKDQGQRDRVLRRSASLLAFLRTLAANRPDDVVVRSIEAEGPSKLIVNGLALDARAVDELGLVLSRELAAAGWSARPHHKTGKGTMTSGGPWEFSVEVVHEEAAAEAAIRREEGY